MKKVICNICGSSDALEIKSKSIDLCYSCCISMIANMAAKHHFDIEQEVLRLRTILFPNGGMCNCKKNRWLMKKTIYDVYGPPLWNFIGKGICEQCGAVEDKNDLRTECLPIGVEIYRCKSCIIHGKPVR